MEYTHVRPPRPTPPLPLQAVMGVDGLQDGPALNMGKTGEGEREEQREAGKGTEEGVEGRWT